MKVFALLSPGEDALLSVALSLGETVALRAGADDAGEAALLGGALARGAGRAVRLWDPVLEGVDYLGLASALARTIYVISGGVSRIVVVAADRGQGAVGPALAERLGIPHLCGVVSASWEEGKDDTGTLRIRRRTLTGVQVLRGPAPVVLCVLPQPQLATVPSAPPPPGGTPATPESMTLEQVGLSAAELQPWQRMQGLPDRPRCADPGPLRFDSPAALVERLRHDGLLPRR